jgi:class 3 adenylate cyclase
VECPKCQHKNRRDRRFCSECAAPLPSACLSCGFLNEPGEKFCGGCARDLSDAAPQVECNPPSQDKPAASEGERRQATVLFTDLSGYTAMNERLDPEEVEGIMSRIKAEAVKIVESQGGIVSQFVGDEVLALFGIPAAHEDDPRRAVKAALELHELAHSMSPEVEDKIGRPLRMHTGIHSGLMVTSTRDQRDGTIGVTGDTVNTGARLKAFAGDDTILVSPDTQRRIAPFFELEVLPPVEMKGKTLPMVPYRVLGESDIETRFDAAELRGFTPLIGRERELDILKSRVEKAILGNGQFVTVVGEAGVGKSRLLYEFRRSLRREQINVLEGRCQSYGGNSPYLPLIDALRRGLQLRPEDSQEALREAVVVAVKAIDPVLERYIPAFLHLLSISSDEYALPEMLAGEELRRNLQEAYAAFTTQSAGNKPLVFFLEDWHWADEASNAALTYLLGLIAHYPIMLVVIYRPEFAGNWGKPVNHTPIEVMPLDAADGEQIVRAVLEVDGLPRGFNDLIHERTGGNPFFIEEICSNLKEEGVIRIQDGKAALTVSSEELKLPSTVQAVIGSRLDRLDNDHREVLRLASVIGREFGRRLLERAYAGANSLTPLLEALKDQELIQQVRVLPEVAYVFKHVLTQEVVYETLLIERRKELHALVGQAIEALYADRLEEHVEALAHHYNHGKVWDRAVEFQIKAGMKARQKFALETARSYFDRAREILKKEDPDVSWQVRFESVLRQKPIPG